MNVFARTSAAFIVALVLGACAGGGADPSLSGTDGSGGADQGPGADGSGANAEVGPGSEDAAGSPDAGPETNAGDTVDVGEPNGWCAPQPADLMKPLAPDLRAQILAWEATGCSLETLAVDEGLDGTVDVEETFPSEPCGEGCAEQLPAFAVAWTQDSEYGLRRPEHRRGVVEARRLDDGSLEAVLTTRRESSNARERLERRWDADGHLLEERHYWDGALWRELSQTWNEDRLVAATVVDHVNGTGTWDYTWEHDSSRAAGITKGTLEHGNQTATVSWDYDYMGRPLQVVRKVDDETWLDQRWFWDEAHTEAGVLAQRKSMWHATESYIRRPLDDHRPRQTVHAHSPDIWADALVGEGNGCLRVPTSVTHGYPADEGLWDLGWPVDERPHGIGFDYGYQGYAYNYGDEAWYGHAGVAAGIQWHPPNEDGEATLVYDDDHRLVEETVTRWDDEGEASSEATRTRKHAGGRVAEDRLERTADGETLVTTLAFAWDAERRLSERAYLYGDDELARHTWEWDSEGRIVAHGIRWHAQGGQGGGSALRQEWAHEGRGVAIPSDLPAEPPLVAIHERIWSDTGSEAMSEVTWQRVDGATGDVSFFKTVRTEPAPGGFVVEVDGGYVTTRTTYNLDGHRVAGVQKYDSGETWSWTYDARPEPLPGGLALGGWTFDVPGGTEDATFGYTCE